MSLRFSLSNTACGALEYRDAILRDSVIGKWDPIDMNNRIYSPLIHYLDIRLHNALVKWNPRFVGAIDHSFAANFPKAAMNVMAISVPEKPAPIHALPIETLEEVFSIHVNVNYASRLPLMLTCRTWYHTATHLGDLWRNLYLGDDAMPGNPTIIHCSSLEHMITTLKRTVGSEFDLHIQIPSRVLREAREEQFAWLTDNHWLTRCRSLKFFTNSGSIPDGVVTIFESQSFPALRSLSIEHMSTPSCARILSEVMRRIEETNEILDSLYLENNRRVHNLGVDLVAYPRILGRLRSLDIDNIADLIPWADMHVLGELSVASTAPVELCNQYDGIPTSLRKLTTEVYPNLQQFPATVHGNLTHLTLGTSLMRWELPTQIVSFPRLIALTLCSSPIDLRYIDAPKLDEFNIECHGYFEQDDFYPQFQGASINPRILNLSQNRGPNPMARFLEAQILWDRVEELHVTTIRDSFGLDPKLAKAVGGVDVTESIFPVLRVMTVLHPNRYNNPVDELEKRRRVQDLKGIAKSRKVTNALTPLEHVKIGWYSAPSSTALDDPSRTYWHFEWKDCLGVRDN